MNKEYLTEQNLVTYLNKIYSSIEWIHDKTFPGYRFRPDYRSEELKMVIEFDGYQHYTKASVINKDIEKDSIYEEQGYSIIRIPYFVQLETRTILKLFNKEIIVDQTYPHGFIADDSTLILPADYCESGIIKFQKDLAKFEYIREEIINSLKNKAKKLGPDNVLPPSMLYLLD